MAVTSKYLQIAQKLIADIENDHLALNAKLPSLRSIMTLHNVSMTTAMACYRHMEEIGYALAEAKKGFFVQKPYSIENTSIFPQFKSSITNVPERQLESFTDISIDSLATAKLDTRLIDHAIITRSIHAITKKSNFTLNYENPQGNSQLRVQLSHHFNQQGFINHPDELVITNGCLDAVVSALEIVSKPGDVIIVSSPCYSGLLDILSLLERAIIEIPSTEEGIDLDQLCHVVEHNRVTACILTANHQNPSGHSINNEQKKLIAQLAAKYELPIIEDDVFRELAHQKNIPLPIKYYDDAGWVLWCSSFSKTLAPGLRLGWCNPGRFLEKYVKLRKIKTLGINHPIQAAMADYVEKGHYSRHLKKINKALSLHCRTYIEFLVRHLPKNSKIYVPKGGLTLWLCLPNVDTKKLSISLAQKGVYTQHGSSFTTTDLYQDCLRLNIGLVPDDHLFRQLETISKTINDMVLCS
ncbi:MAG: PLP-dependent aminotransferase family protein [Colwellia sp.]|nr:PLP-dependent aminotransferase family protein [Colwellia sp.]